MRTLVLAFAVVLVACGGDPTPLDSGTDASLDAGIDAGPPDAGPVCTGCATGEACCGTPEAPVCSGLSSDLHHCGACGIDCEGDGRGDRCELGQCACGDFDLGCIGSFTSFCCVVTGRDPYCANLAQDRTDCGECGNECAIEVANQCEGGRCVCGDTRSPCDGTPESTCCSDAFETYACVDTTTDRNHCGACGNRCPTSMRCLASTCSP